MSKVMLTDSTKIEISSFKTPEGELYLNLRKMFLKKGSEDWMPTKQGLSIPSEFAGKLLKRMKVELENIEENAVELEAKGKSKSKSKPKSKASRDDDE